MARKRQTKLVVTALALAVMVAVWGIVGVTDTAMAKKPPKDPPPGEDPLAGTIYYACYGFWSMNPDGSDKTPLPVVGGPSIARHPAEGDRWFLQVREVPGTYPINALPPDYMNQGLSSDGLETVGFTVDPDPEGAWTVSYTVMIETVGGEGEPDTFKWHAHSDLFGQTENVSAGAITGGDQELELLIEDPEGPTVSMVLTIKFDSTTGHGFLDFWEIYVEKTQRSELFAVSEDGQLEVQLTDDPDVQPWMPRDPSRALPSWATQNGVVDGKVSYLAQRWGPDGTIIEGSEGLYEADVDWVTFTTDTTPTKLPVSVAMEPYDWSPDGNLIVHVDNGSLYVADPYVEGPGYLLCQGWGPRWSPVLDDGTTLIAFHVGAEVRAISPDGGPASTIVAVGKNRTIWGGGGIHWSPLGTHLVYTQLKYKPLSCDIYRVGVDGSDATNLTNDLTEDAYSLGWRD